MCGRFAFTPDEDFTQRFKVTNQLDLPLSNSTVVPGQNFPVVINQGAYILWPMKWGMIPFWAKDSRIGGGMFNARAESVTEKPAFRNAFKSQRCLIPANGFYEWKLEETGKKTPYYFQIQSRSVFAFAGLYDIWEEPVGGRQTYSFTIITTIPNGQVRPIHDRMPVILEQKNESVWLSQSSPSSTLRQLLRPSIETLSIVQQ